VIVAKEVQRAVDHEAEQFLPWGHAELAGLAPGAGATATTTAATSTTIAHATLTATTGVLAMGTGGKLAGAAALRGLFANWHAS